MASPSGTIGESTVTYEELAHLEQDGRKIADELIKTEWKLKAPYYKKRRELIAKLQNFWPLVFEQAPPELDQWIQPSDSQVFADALKNVEIDRHEVDENPRSVTIKFEFAENDYFEETVLEKKFTWKSVTSGKDGAADPDWEGLVSEPVKITWKKGKDLTHGMTDLLYELWELKKKESDDTTKDQEALKKKIEKVRQKQEGKGELSDGMSFFTWFGFQSEGYHQLVEKMEKVEDGQKPADDEDEDDEMVGPEEFIGEEVATLIAEDLWPQAVKYFINAQEIQDGDLSELDEDMEDEDDEDDEEVDIRALVQGNGKRKGKDNDASAPKKRKK